MVTGLFWVCLFITSTVKGVQDSSEGMIDDVDTDEDRPGRLEAGLLLVNHPVRQPANVERTVYRSIRHDATLAIMSLAICVIIGSYCMTILVNAGHYMLTLLIPPFFVPPVYVVYTIFYPGHH